MPVLSLACHLRHNTPNIPSRYNNEQTTKQTKAINNSYIYINISCKCDTNRAGHFTLDAYASRPVACFPPFGATLTYWNGSNLGFPGISWRMHRGNGLIFCMPMYLGHFQNRLVYGHGLLIFLILALFWLSEKGEICGFWAFPGEHLEGMPWNFVCWCIFTAFRTD